LRIFQIGYTMKGKDKFGIQKSRTTVLLLWVILYHLHFYIIHQHCNNTVKNFPPIQYKRICLKFTATLRKGFKYVMLVVLLVVMLGGCGIFLFFS